VDLGLEAREIGIGAAAIHVVELARRNREVRAHLDERQHDATTRGDRAVLLDRLAPPNGGTGGRYSTPLKLPTPNPEDASTAADASTVSASSREAIGSEVQRYRRS
jgi:hypothetical protein